MSNPSLHVLAVAGGLGEKSATRAVLSHTAGLLRAAGCGVDVLDLHAEPLPLLNPESAFTAPYSAALRARLERADVFLLATPDYHGSMSGTLKNFLDHGWKEFAGKLFASVVGSHEKGLTVHDQIRTAARQCYAWSLPYGVSFVDKEDWKDGQPSAPFAQRLDLLVRDVRVYGGLLAAQRQADLAGAEPGFLARYRK
jgi:NAD(P)H-dependent FMN reductase